VPQAAAKTFQATLERDGTPLKWVIVRIPFDAAKAWGKRGQIRVKGEINGFAFRTSLFPTGDGHHVLLVNKRMQAGGKTTLGSTARFRMQPDLEKHELAVPEEFERMLAEDEGLRRWYNQLSNSNRNEISKWIQGVKSPEARARRVEQMTERLLSAMDAERDLPPLLRVAFARDAQAEQGWKHMSASQRRGQLLAIFYYRSPEARARRVAKVLEEARRHAQRKQKPMRGSD
jgi:uncharacterized protein YdeI (YjbR/CyaY-like superfamily)